MKQNTVRCYHFLSAANALDDLNKRRLKLSEIDTLNDPFELWCTAQSDRRLRQALTNWKTEVGQRFGMLSFCKRWHNPVLWSHYADKHRGMCLGFDLPSEKASPVRYVAHRLPLRFPLTQATTRELLFTKYKDWRYEEELRGWFSLEDRDPASGLFFYDFEDQIRLRELILGPLCPVERATIESALFGYAEKFELSRPDSHSRRSRL
jgi:hypothetical protein